jgi:hypothetical protein
LDNKEQLLSGIMVQAATEEEAAAFRPFLESLTEEQAQQLLALDGYTTEYKIPIWDDEIGGPPRDAQRERGKQPDRYINGTTTPRSVADDLFVLMLGAYDLEEVKARIETVKKLDERNAQYWQALGAILGEPRSFVPSVTGHKVKKIDFPLDKVNSNVWKLLEEDTHGQIAIAVEKRASRKPLNILYSINFDALDKDISVSRQLDPFDKRVYMAVSALYRAGNMLISFSMIHSAMGYTTRPSNNEIERIRKSVYKMRRAVVYLNNAEEAKAYKYDKVVIDGPLLPSFMKSGIINGKQVEEALGLICEPPLMNFARGRKQITTIEKKLLETPVSKTNQNLLIEDYLIERIANAKTGRQPTKILYDTLYKEAKITEKKQRQRAGGKLKAILDHYVQQGHIQGYQDEGDGIRIII